MQITIGDYSFSTFKKSKRNSIVLAIILIPAIFFGVQYLLKDEIYEQSVSLVRNSVATQGLVGEPIDFGFIVYGEKSSSDSTGSATVSYDITGPKGEAVVNYHAVKENGLWTFTLLEVSDEDGLFLIDVLSEAKRSN